MMRLHSLFAFVALSIFTTSFTTGVAADQATITEIITGVSEFKGAVSHWMESGIETLKNGNLDEVNEKLKEEGVVGEGEEGVKPMQGSKGAFVIEADPEGAKMLEEFSNTWLSLLGWSTGVTGLVKDFAFQYFGQSHFHDRNGPLIDQVKKLAMLTAHIPSTRRKSRVAKIMPTLNKMVAHGQHVFDKDGALKNFFADLKKLTQSKTIPKSMLATDKADFAAIQKAFQFVVTDLKSAKAKKEAEDLKDMDDDDDDDEL